MRCLIWYFLVKDCVSFNESVWFIYKWDFDIFIFCYGDVVEGNGKELFYKVFLWYFEGKK